MDHEIRVFIMGQKGEYAIASALLYLAGIPTTSSESTHTSHFKYDLRPSLQVVSAERPSIRTSLIGTTGSAPLTSASLQAINSGNSSRNQARSLKKLTP